MANEEPEKLMELVPLRSPSTPQITGVTPSPNEPHEFMVEAPPIGPFTSLDEANFAALNLAIPYNTNGFAGFKYTKLVAKVVINSNDLLNETPLGFPFTVPEFADHKPKRFYLPYTRQWFTITPEREGLSSRSLLGGDGWELLRNVLQLCVDDTLLFHQAAFKPDDNAGAGGGSGECFYVVTCIRASKTETFRFPLC